MINVEKHLLVFSGCKFVKGASRSAIYDLQRDEMSFIPNDVFVFINSNKKLKIKDILSKYNKDEQEIVIEYIEYLLEQEFIYLGDQNDVNAFTEMDSEWFFPGEISNAIIELSEITISHHSKICNELNALGCQAIQLVSYMNRIPLNILSKILNSLKATDSIRNIEVIIPSSNDDKTSNFDEITFLNTYPKIDTFIVHSSEVNDKIEALNGRSYFIYTTEKITNRNCCGVIKEDYFSFNIDTFMESLHYNSCLHKKIAIDANGEIKNCPSLHKGFGNIKSISLAEALFKKEFKNLWSVKKDQIKVCKDCEFRYVCTDCRAYIKNSEDIYSKPLKCSYNPYTNEWEQ
jgi:SPASM domain peptide maturase of grasp-with-spasm system